MPHSPENSEAIEREIKKPPLDEEAVAGFAPGSPFVDQEAIARQANGLAAAIEDLADLVGLPGGSSPEDVVAEVRSLKDQHQELIAEARLVRERLGLADSDTTLGVVSRISALATVDVEIQNLLRETGEVRKILDLPQSEASVVMLDRLASWKRGRDVHRKTMRGFATALGMEGEASGTTITIHLANLQSLVHEVREVLDVPSEAPLTSVLIKVREAAHDSATLERIGAHLRMRGGEHRQDVEERVAVMQAHVDSVRDHLFLPRESEGWLVTKTIREMKEALLDSARWSSPVPIVIPFDTLSPEAQERIRQHVQPPAEGGHVRALASALALDEDASAEWVVEVLLNQLRTLLKLDSTPPTERSAHETLQILAERITLPMIDHAPQPGIHYQVIRESSGPRGLSLYDVRSATFLARKISVGDIYGRLWTLIRDGHQPDLMRQLTRAIDAEELNVHIGGPLNDDLQVSVFPQDETVKALVTLELNPAPTASPKQDKIHFVTCFVDVSQRTITRHQQQVKPTLLYGTGTTVSLEKESGRGMYVVTTLTWDPRVRSHRQTLAGARDELLSGEFGQRYAVAVQEDLVDELLKGQGEPA